MVLYVGRISEAPSDKANLPNNIIRSRFGVFYQQRFYNITNYLFTLGLVGGIIERYNMRRFGVV